MLGTEPAQGRKEGDQAAGECGSTGIQAGRREDRLTDELPSFSVVFHDISSIGSFAAALEDELL